MSNYRTVTGIAIYDLQGNYLRTEKTVSDVVDTTKIHQSRVSDCLYNRSNYAGKYQFRFKYGKRVINTLPKIK